MRQISVGIKHSCRTTNVSLLADVLLAPFKRIAAPKTACNIAGTLFVAAVSGKVSAKNLRRMRSRFYQRATSTQRPTVAPRHASARRTRSAHTAHRPAPSGTSVDGDGPAHPARIIHAAYTPRIGLTARFARISFTGLDCPNVHAFPRIGGAA